MSHAIIQAETMVLPSGMGEDDPELDSYAVYVRWNGPGKWIVTGLFRDTRLSVKGRKWTFWVAARNRHLYLFPSYESALDAAVSAVDSVQVGGQTFADVRECRTTQVN